MTLEVLKIIILICSTTSVEDNSSNWSEFKQMQAHQRECREELYKCFDAAKGDSVSRILSCDKRVGK